MQDQQPGQEIPYYSSQPMPGQPMPGQPSYGMAPIVEQEEGWGKIGIAMVTLAVIFAGGVAYFIATSGDEELDTAAAQSPSLAEGTESATASDAGATLAPDAEAAVATPSAADETRKALLEGVTADAGVAVVALDASNANTASGPLRANGEVDRPAGLVSLSLESEPPGADVIRKQDGVRLGKTPYLYEIEATPGNVQFVLQLEGYKSMSLSLPSDRDGVRQIMLLPGKGGPPIPAPNPEKSTPAKTDSAKSGPASQPTPPAKTSSAKPRPVKAKPTRSEPAKTEPKKPVKPKGGRVDYNADPIPLD